MKLEICNEETVAQWKECGIKLICIGVDDYLYEIDRKFEIADSILMILDYVSSSEGVEFKLKERKIIVRSIDETMPILENVQFLITSPRYNQIYRELIEDDRWSGIEKIFIVPTKADFNYMKFMQKHEKIKIAKKLAFRSGNDIYVAGADCNDNAMALFNYLVEHRYNEIYELVWFVHDPGEFPEFPNIKNVKLVSYEWENSDDFNEVSVYFTELLSSKILFYTITNLWLRYCSQEQIRVNLWHGCGFKGRKNRRIATDMNHDLWTVTSELYIDIHAREFGISRSKVIDTGLAKEDLLFIPPKESLSRLLEIPDAGKYIFWLPTFRSATSGLEHLNEYNMDSDTGLPIIKTMEDARKLNEILEKLDIFILIKLHPIQNQKAITELSLSKIRVVKNQEIANKRLQTNTLLSKADALITDYSSAAVDYMLLDRPIAFAMEDVNRYEQSRGFVFDNIHEYLPGKEIYTFDEFVDFIKEIDSGIDSFAEKRRKLSKVMHTHHDGNNCRRILEAVGIAKNE